MDITILVDEAEIFCSSQVEARVCRAINCGDAAHAQDVFCLRCREEVDALRAMLRRRSKSGFYRRREAA